MVNYLEQHHDTVLVYGPTQPIDEDGNPLGKAHSPRPEPNPAWTFDIPVLFNFDDYCNGALKGLFRRQVVRRFNLVISPVLELQYSERCWLFAMSLIGRFHFIDDYRYEKRLYPTSTHAQWVPTRKNQLGQWFTMNRYLWRLPNPIRRKLTGLLFLTILTGRKLWVLGLYPRIDGARRARLLKLSPAWRGRLARWISRLAGDNDDQTSRLLAATAESNGRRD
jgi:hypothetical protein